MTSRNLLVLLAGAGLLVGCDEAEEILSSVFTTEASGPRQLADDDLYLHLQKDRAAAPETDVASALRVIDNEVAVETGEKQAALDDPDVVRFLKKTAQNRLTIRTDDYVQNMDTFLPQGEPQQKQACDDSVSDVERLHDEFLIPNIEKIPVRNQKYRGTCAAFTGVGAIEYAALNSEAEDIGANPNLPTLDLSEQRFYWLSKPDCQADGCRSPYAEGSWYGTGFDATEASWNGDMELVVPLEQDCPYDPNPGDTDTHVPQANSCGNGSVSVRKMSSWCGLDSVVDWLHQGYAVPYASPLSDNWEDNDGLITLAGHKGAGSTVHAGGHAYLIVGYRKLPSSMPAEEGGMCFIIKNSWGTGWGAGGFSCMTVGWMQAVRFDGWDVLTSAQPIPIEVALSEELANTAPPPDEGNEADVDIVEEEDEPIDADPDELLPPEEPDVDPAPDGEGDGDTGEDVTPEPPPADLAATRLVGPDDHYYKVETKEEGDELVFVGLLASGDKTGALRLKKSGNSLMFKGDTVGRVDPGTGDMWLCSGESSALCSLRLRRSDNLAYIAFRDDDLRAVSSAEVSAERGSWADVPLGNQMYGVFIPSDVADPNFLLSPKTYLRTGSGDPARLSLAPSSDKQLGGFDIKLHGIPVGQLRVDDPASSSLCSDSFSDACQILGGDSLSVIPRNRRRLP